jgi:hypothetical protein
MFGIRASWSPDGRRISFFQEAGNQQVVRDRVGIIDVSDGHVRFLTARQPDYRAPLWAPDSRRVAVKIFDKITIFSLSGKPLHRLGGLFTYPRAWTRSGLYLLQGASRLSLHRSAHGTEGSVRVFRIDRSQTALDALVPRDGRNAR